MANETLHALLAITVAASFALFLLCASRAALRRVFGAQTAYTAWLAAPVVLVAVLLPTGVAPPLQMGLAPLHNLASAGASTALSGSGGWQQWLAAIWLAVAAVMLAQLWCAHARYRNHLGATDGPAVVGLWRPQIILPADFKTRYTAQEQQLILAHEAVHVRRRDPLANALCALIQCVLWFHPLVHYAARRFRLDQELSCDAAVMQAYPRLRRSYAEAMLKTQITTQAALIHCHWQSTPPLKERIMQLQQTPPSSLRRQLGRATVAALIAACGYGAMTANAGVQDPDKYMVKLKLSVAGASSAPVLLVREGEPASVVSKGKNGVWRTELVLNQASDNTVFVKTVIKHDDRVIGSPGLQVRIGETAAVAVDDGYQLQLAVSKPRD